ncbi:hypothetical protein J1614_003315 [Plenodomus biglobosus]|nr:hypothetical protein J1614_003315 [Plenodomus biglobosus]
MVHFTPSNVRHNILGRFHTSLLRTGDNSGVQVVHIGSGLVAKIYGPVYYGYHGSNWTRRQPDFSPPCGRQYSRTRGSHDPTGFGTRSANASLGSQPFDERRAGKHHDEAHYDLRVAGVEHGDIAPRNVPISTSTSYADFNLRLTLVDLGFPYVYRILWGGPALLCRHNPISDWATAQQLSSWGWLPRDDEERITWVWSIWGEGQDGKYVEVERDPDKSSGVPREPSLEECEEEDSDDAPKVMDEDTLVAFVPSD